MAEGAQDRREGRGRLSSIDRLPEEAEPEILWALEQLRERKLEQTEILAEFNARLAALGIDQVISKSAFNRYSVRKAISYRTISNAREITNDIFASIGVAGADETTMVLAELVKAQIFEIVEKGSLAPKDVKALGTTLRDLATANRASADHRKRLEEKEAAVQAVAEHAEEAMRSAGLPAARIKQLREEFLGVRPQPAP